MRPDISTVKVHEDGDVAAWLVVDISGVARARREALHQTAAERVADAGRVDDPVWRHGPHVNTVAVLIDRTSFFASRDDQGLRLLQHVAFTHAGLLPQQFEFIVVGNHDPRADNAVLELVA